MAKAAEKAAEKRTRWVVTWKWQAFLNLFGPWWLWPLVVHEASEDKRNRLWRVQVLFLAAELRRTAQEVEVEVVKP